MRGDRWASPRLLPAGRGSSHCCRSLAAPESPFPTPAHPSDSNLPVQETPRTDLLPQGFWLAPGVWPSHPAGSKPASASQLQLLASHCPGACPPTELFPAGGAVWPFLVCVLHPVSHHPAPAPLADMSDSPPPLMRSDLGTQLLVEGKLERESAELGAPKT